MRKILVCITFCVIFPCVALADLPTDQDYENLDELRVKIVKMKREMDKFMKDILATYPPEQAVVDLYGQDIRIDVSQTSSDVVVKADLPGMAKDKIDITLENSRVLRIAGSRDVSKEETGPGIIRQERMQGRFERVIELPVECKNEGIRATYKDGVLEVKIPKKGVLVEQPVKVDIE